MTATATTSVPNKPGVWYMRYTSECVICGRYEETRERREGPKPEKYSDRRDHREYGCGNHFS